MENTNKVKSGYWWRCFGVFVGIGLISLIFIYYSPTRNWRFISIWMAGAAALGLLSGYTTGASTQSGTTGEFLKFISGGILIPLFGGIATLISGTMNTPDGSSGIDNVLTKISNSTPILSQDSLFCSFAIIGGFLFVYCFLATIGIYLGVRSRIDKIEIKLSGTK